MGNNLRPDLANAMKSNVSDAYNDEDATVTAMLGTYTGRADLGLDLGDGSSFADEAKSGRQFDITITNTTGVDKTICLCPAYFDTQKVVITQSGTTPFAVSSAEIVHTDVSKMPSGYAIDAVVDDGNILYVDSTHGIAVTTSTGKVREFLNFIKRNPMRVVDFIVDVNDKSVYPKYVSRYKLDSILTPSEGRISVDKYFQPTSQQDKRIIVPEELQFDDRTLLFFRMPGLVGTTNFTQIKFTFTVGAIASVSEGLRKKAKVAVSNIKHAIKNG